jgi:hypothetical protein
MSGEEEGLSFLRDRRIHQLILSLSCVGFSADQNADIVDFNNFRYWEAHEPKIVIQGRKKFSAFGTDSSLDRRLVFISF